MSDKNTSIETLDDYFMKDIMVVEDNIVLLVRPREQYMFDTQEYKEEKE